MAKHSKCILSFMGVSDLKILCLKTVEIKRRYMKKFLLCINRDIFKIPRQIFLLNDKRLE